MQRKESRGFPSSTISRVWPSWKSIWVVSAQKTGAKNWAYSKLVWRADVRDLFLLANIPKPRSTSYIRENVRGQMVVRVNGNSEHYNGHVGNKSSPGPLSRATYASVRASYTHLRYRASLAIFLPADFYPRKHTGNARDATQKFAKAFERALASLWFVSRIAARYVRNTKCRAQNEHNEQAEQKHKRTRACAFASSGWQIAPRRKLSTAQKYQPCSLFLFLSPLLFLTYATKRGSPRIKAADARVPGN